LHSLPARPPGGWGAEWGRPRRQRNQACRLVAASCGRHRIEVQSTAFGQLI